MGEDLSLCPCGSGTFYTKCCGVFHGGELPKTPEQLMRSRYTAYVRRLGGYLIDTTHPDSPEFDTDTAAWLGKIHEFCVNNQLKGLKVLQSGENWVLFEISYSKPPNSDKNFSYKELSHFSHEKGKWLYLSSELPKQE